MKRSGKLSLWLLGAIALVAVPGSIAAQTVENGQLTGKVVSGGSVPFTAGGTYPVLTVPGTGHYVATQICAYNGNAQLKVDVVFTGSATGGIGVVGYDATGLSNSCRSFEPGFALQPGEVVSCVANLTVASPFTSVCSITGVLTDR